MRILALCLALCLALSGCTGWMDGSYVSIKPHTEKNDPSNQGRITVASREEIQQALEKLIERGSETGKLYVVGLTKEAAQEAMTQAVADVLRLHPVAVFVAEDITWELGMAANETALAVTVHYNQNRAQLHNIRKAASMDAMVSLIGTALRNCEPHLIVQVSDYTATDFMQLVRDYGDAYPEQVMEQPQLAVEMYPEKGAARVIELRFFYQTDPQSLKEMQEYVQPVFSAATMYVMGEDDHLRKYDQLHSFLMGRNDYTLATSLTPAYSLLRHGVGDSRAFAVVYAAMCLDAGLECRVVSGTCQGEPRFWNMICVDGSWWHTDLLGSPGALRMLSDAEMAGYVWDYSAYPACG